MMPDKFYENDPASVALLILAIIFAGLYIGTLILNVILDSPNRGMEPSCHLLI